MRPQRKGPLGLWPWTEAAGGTHPGWGPGDGRGEGHRNEEMSWQAEGPGRPAPGSHEGLSQPSEFTPAVDWGALQGGVLS